MCRSMGVHLVLFIGFLVLFIGFLVLFIGFVVVDE